MIKTKKYVRKPLFVDAIQVTNDNFAKVAEWCMGEIVNDEKENPGKSFIKVRVHKPLNTKQTQAYLGDWILYTDRGYKVYTTKAFHASFDLAEPIETLEEEEVEA